MSSECWPVPGKSLGMALGERVSPCALTLGIVSCPHEVWERVPVESRIDRVRTHVEGLGWVNPYQVT